MTAQNEYTELKDRILTHLAKSKNTVVMISTQLTAIQVTPKTLKSFADAGYELFRATDKGLYIMRGKSYECISYCKIQFGEWK